jgi:hypothetical protein
MTYKILTDTETQIKFVSYTIDGVEYKIGPNSDNGVLRHQTEAEALAMATKFKDWDSKANERKLSEIKSIRLEKLQETDWMSLSDVTMPDYIKTWRQNLRDIPANNDSSKYDDLLKRDDKGNLTHTIWAQPTE